jgi:hypothetical protein
MNETTTAVPLNVMVTTIERLHAMIARQLRNNRIITINEYRFRFSKRGHSFTDPDTDDVMQALETGVFVGIPEWLPNGQPDRSKSCHWLHLGHLDDIEDVLAPYLTPLTIEEREALGAQICFQAVTADMRNSPCRPLAAAHQNDSNQYHWDNPSSMA